MKSVEQIQKKLDYAERIVKEYKGCTPGTEGFEKLEAAEHLIRVLRWILAE